MDGLGKIGSVQHLEAENDSEAIRLACDMQLSVIAEIWDRDRFVAGIPAACHDDEAA